MPCDDDRFVPKVHPLTRAAEPDDPMELATHFTPGDPEMMLDCLIYEFMGLGYTGDQLMAMFHDPEYPVLNQLREHFGESEIRRRMHDDGNGGWESLRVTAEIDETPEPDDHDHELIQLTVRRRGV